jgi:hypothetical protein
MQVLREGSIPETVILQGNERSSGSNLMKACSILAHDTQLVRRRTLSWSPLAFSLHYSSVAPSSGYVEIVNLIPGANGNGRPCRYNRFLESPHEYRHHARRPTEDVEREPRRRIEIEIQARIDRMRKIFQPFSRPQG